MKVRISQNDNGIVKSISVESWSRQRRCWRKTLQHQQQRTNMSHSYIPLSVCSFLFSCITYRRMIVYSLTKNQKVLNLLSGVFFQADNTASNTNFDCWYCHLSVSWKTLYCISNLSFSGVATDHPNRGWLDRIGEILYIPLCLRLLFERCTCTPT